jgi:hypothetical protein
MNLDQVHTVPTTTFMGALKADLIPTGTGNADGYDFTADFGHFSRKAADISVVVGSELAGRHEYYDWIDQDETHGANYSYAIGPVGELSIVEELVDVIEELVDVIGDNHSLSTVRVYAPGAWTTVKGQRFQDPHAFTPLPRKK